MSLTNPNKVVTEERLSDFYQQILPYMGGMPEMLANKFNKSDLYSTDEKMIGRWIDGKPLYQKTVTMLVPTTSSDGTSAINQVSAPSNIDMINSFNAVMVMSTGNGNIHSLPMTPTGSTASGILRTFVFYNRADEDIVCQNTRVSNNGSTAYITIQYTKTTDTSIEIGSDTDYSTTEKIVGTWIDGKPLYQKTVIGTTPLTVNSSNNIPIGSSIDVGLIVSAFIEDETGNCFPISPMTRNSTGITNLRCVLMTNTSSEYPNTIQIRHFQTSSETIWLNMPAYITIQYTKTTD